MNRAVFLDRDGTLIDLVHHLTDPADVRLIPGAAGAVRALRAAGWKVVIVTNQSVIGRGKLTEDGLETVHAEMQRQLCAHDTTVDGIYFCPLKPVQADPTIVEDEMRKPGPGMLRQAAREMDLMLHQSWMVGDTVSDMLAGRNAGCRTILVKTGYGGDYAHDRAAITHEAADLKAAAGLVLSEADA